MPSRWLFRGSWWLCGARCERPSAQHPCGVSSTHRNGRPTGQLGSPAPISHSTQRGHSSAGRAPAWHAGGQRFESAWLHLILKQTGSGVSARLSAESLFVLLFALTAPRAATPAPAGDEGAALFGPSRSWPAEGSLWPDSEAAQGMANGHPAPDAAAHRPERVQLKQHSADSFGHGDSIGAGSPHPAPLKYRAAREQLVTYCRVVRG